MKKNLSVCAILLLIVTALFAAAVLAGENRRVFIINSPILPPYITAAKDGFEDLLAKEAYGRLGIEIDISHVSAERGLVLLNEGFDDGIMSRIAGLSEKYSNIVQVEESVLSWSFVAFARDKNIRITNWNSLRPYHVAIIRGWKILERNIVDTASLTLVENERILFGMLNGERIDIAVYALHPGVSTIRDLGFSNISPVMPPLAVSEKYFYVGKKHRDLAPKLAAALRAMKADGAYLRIRQRTIID